MITVQILFSVSFIWLLILTIMLAIKDDHKDAIKDIKKRLTTLEFTLSLSEKKETFSEKRLKKEEKTKLLINVEDAIKRLEKTENAYIGRNLSRLKQNALITNSDREYVKLNTYQKFLINNKIIKDYYS